MLQVWGRDRRDFRPVDIGLSVASSVPGARPDELLASILDRIRAAREAGLTSLHVGDKHGVRDPYAANVAFAGRLSAEWPHQLGILAISSMWNPVLLAEQLATLAALSAGSLVVVMALGDGPGHFASVGVSIRDRLRLFTDGLKVTRALLAGETVTATVGPYAIKKARVGLGGQLPISWWIAASEPPAIERAAQLADGWLASAKLTSAEAARAIETYRRAGGSGRTALRRELFVGASTEEVDAVAEPVVNGGYRGYPPQAIVRGTAGKVADELAEFAHLGFDEVLVRSFVPDHHAAVASIERLADVRQRLNP